MRNTTKQLRKILPPSMVIAGMVIVSVTLGWATQRNLAPEDTAAIYGGRLESGYQSAGYLLATEKNGVVSVCGSTALSANRMISAAHCVKPDALVDVGYSVFDVSNNIAASEFTTHPDWDYKTSTNDIVIISTGNRPLPISTFADISEPELGCNYTVVGYGRTDVETEIKLQGGRDRRSTSVCITYIGENTFYIKGQGGGICYGDSGSPIFRTDTNQLVGIVSAIISTTPGESPKCSVENQAAAVRLVVKRDFIAGLAPQTTFGLTNNNSGVGVLPSQAQQIDNTVPGSNNFNLGIPGSILNQLPRTSDSTQPGFSFQFALDQQTTVLVIVGLLLGIALLIAGLVSIYRSRHPEQSPPFEERFFPVN